MWTLPLGCGDIKAEEPYASWGRNNGLVTTGGRLIKHARYHWLLLAEGHLTRRLFGSMVCRIASAAGAHRIGRGREANRAREGDDG